MTKLPFIGFFIILLSACGFQLRGLAGEFPKKTLYILAPADDLTASSLVERIPEPYTITKSKQDADYIIEIFGTENKTAVSATDSLGMVREFKINKAMMWGLQDAKTLQYVIEPEILSSEQLLNYSDSEVLAYEYEVQSTQTYVARKMADRMINRINRTLSRKITPTDQAPPTPQPNTQPNSSNSPKKP